MFCPSCGTKLPDDAKFCDRCGERLPELETQVEEPTVRFTPVPACEPERVPAPEHRETPQVQVEEPTMRFTPVPAQETRQTVPQRETTPRGGKKPANKALLISVIAAAVVILAVVLCVLFLGDKRPTGGEPQKNSQEQLLPIRTAEPTPAPVSTPEPAATPTPIPTQVPRLLDETELDERLYAEAPDAISGVYILNLNTGEGYAAGAAYGQMSASALVNIPVLFTVAEQIDDGDLTWNDTVEFRYTLAGRASLDAAMDGAYLTVRELVDAMLLYSDNNAANSLIRFLGYDDIAECCHDNGFSSVRMEVLIGGTTDTADNYVSCADVAGMLRMLWQNETGIGSDYLLECMRIQDTTARLGLGAQLPDSALFLNHNGYRGDLYNEAAIIRDGDLEYIAVFMGHDADWTTLAAGAGAVNGFVYGELQG
jgi:beta-lactamase class A